MESSEEEALSVLRKWLEERSTVRLQFESFKFKGIFTGIVIKVSEQEVMIGPSDFSYDVTPQAVFSISLTAPHRFEFKDSRDAINDEDRKDLEATMTFMVVILFSSGDRCILYGLACD
jgi:hypothetical protein